MNALLVALLGVLLIPLFVATWRTSLLGLACQGWLMAWLAYRAHGASPSNWLTLVDLALVRGLWAPLTIARVLQKQRVPPRNDVIPPNILSWALALAAVLMAFDFSESLVGHAGQARGLVAVASSGVLLGFLVLSTQSGPLSQIVGALRIENAIALFELGGHATAHVEQTFLQAGQLGVFVLSVGFYRWYLSTLQSPKAAPSNAPEGPAL